MNRFAPHATLHEPHDLTFLAGTPYVYHCHHFNLFHDQTIDDVLGEESGFALRARAARDAFRPLLRNLFVKLGATTPTERVDIAQELFGAMGQGRMAIESGPAPGVGQGVSSHLHYATAWREKYGERIRRLDPVDAVGSGFLAAAVETIQGLQSPLMAREVECVAKRDPRCRLVTEPDRSGLAPSSIDEAVVTRWLPQSEGGLHEAEIGGIADGLQGFVRGVSGDERGLVEAFGVFVTQHLAGYYNETGFSAVRHVEAVSPAVVGPCEDLLREAGHVCVFNTFGNILLSPEWEGMVGPLRGDPEEIVRGAAAIARGLGFGRWSISEHVVGKRLVLRTTSNYEAAHWLERYGTDTRSRCYFMQGAALAFMVLANRVPWAERPKLTQRFYDELFRGQGIGYRVSVPRCLTKGDTATEIVVEAV